MQLYQDTDLAASLQDLGIIDAKDLKAAIEESQSTHISLFDAIIKNDLISYTDLCRVISDLINVPFIDLSTIAIPSDVLNIIPEVVAKKQRIIAFQKDPQGLEVAMEDPSNLEIVEFIKKKTGLPVKVYLASPDDIFKALNLYQSDITQAFDEIIHSNVTQVTPNGNANNIEAPIIKIVDTILFYAYKNRASDIHIEPQDKNLLVRFRIDGILHDIIPLPINLHDQIIARLKVMASLRTDEHFAPQDGKIQFITEEEKLDIRISITPIIRGEKVVMRLLSEKSRQFSLISLGFNQSDMEKVESAYNKPYGLILSTGPTGSGKTTTMYAILKLLNKRDVNIMTVEDPVEYDIEGINQIQIGANSGLTFATGLKSILRQDPNIILVGEIRDSETAGIAVNAAMTGHLVLSTLHTNDAATSIPRLIDMGLEPFLIASTVNVIIAQRLVRKICVTCRMSDETSPDQLEANFSKDTIHKYFGDNKIIRVYKGKGCPVCHNTGYEDRVGIYETMVITKEIREAIIARSDASVIKNLAIASGMKTMSEDGLEKVVGGITTIEEVLRVTKET